MAGIKVSKLLTVAFLFTAPNIGYGQISCESIFSTPTQSAPQKLALYALLRDPEMAKALAQKQLESLVLQYASAILKVPASEVLANKKVSPLQIKDLGETGTTRQEEVILLKLAQLSNEGKLQPAVMQILNTLKSKADSIPQLAKLKNIKPEQEAFVVSTLMANVEGILSLRGLSNKSAKNKYVEWPELSDSMLADLNKSPSGMKHILDFSQTKFRSASNLKILVDGPQSFAMRDSLIASAKKSIDIMSWAIYSDKTGFEAADLLIKKKAENISIRIIVDGQTAMKPGYTEAVQKLEKAGVEVIRYYSTFHTFEGQHRKMIIIDGEHMIAGGLNFGDVYSHKNPDLNVPRWRDTDVYLQGDAVVEGSNLFAKVWNDQIRLQSLSLNMMQNVSKAKTASDTKVAVINHDPSQTVGGSTIMLTLLKGIRESQKSIEIENAYVVLFPALKAELQAAIQRGVRVRVLTNSHVSVDEPIIAIPILRSAYDLAKMGAEVFLKKGSTLHSKLAIFDDQHTMVMSYNLHPRSERIEEEMALLIQDSKINAEMRQVFESDISAEKAIKINNAEEIQIPDNLIALPILRVFFDAL